MSEREKLTSSSPLVFKRWRVANGTVGERFFEGIITDIEDRVGALTPCTIAKVNHNLAEADAIEKRIIDCHNACLGMEDPERAIAQLKTELKQVRATNYARQTACYTHGQEMAAKDKEVDDLRQAVTLLTELAAAASLAIEATRRCPSVTPPGGTTVADELLRKRYNNVPAGTFSDFESRYYCLPPELFGKVIEAAAKQWEISHQAQENKS